MSGLIFNEMTELKNALPAFFDMSDLHDCRVSKWYASVFTTDHANRSSTSVDESELRGNGSSVDTDAVNAEEVIGQL